MLSALLILAPPGSSAQKGLMEGGDKPRKEWSPQEWSDATGPLAARRPPEWAVVCATGYVMDTLCIKRGTLLDNEEARSLIHGEGPQLHSYHCLVDYPPCVESGFELLEAPPLNSKGKATGGFTDTYGRLLRFEANEMVQAFFRARGRAGYCSTCTGTGGDERQGPSATVYGTISDKGTSPPTLTVTMIRPPSEPCNASLATAYIKPAAASSSDDGLSDGAIVGIAIGGVVGVLLLIGAIVMILDDMKMIWDDFKTGRREAEQNAKPKADEPSRA